MMMGEGVTWVNILAVGVDIGKNEKSKRNESESCGKVLAGIVVVVVTVVVVTVVSVVVAAAASFSLCFGRISSTLSGNFSVFECHEVESAGLLLPVEDKILSISSTSICSDSSSSAISSSSTISDDCTSCSSI